MTRVKPIRLFGGPVNFIKFLKFHPCADPMPILVETFFPAALRMAIDLYLYDFDDVAREVMRRYPMGGVGATARRGLRHSFKKTQDKKVMARRQVKAVPFSHLPKVQAFTKFFFMITEPIEKVGLAMLFYNAVDNFYYNWTSLLIRRGYCELPALTGPLQLRANDSTLVATQSGNPLGMPIEIINRAGWSHSAFSASLPPGSYVAVFSLEVKRPTAGVTPGIQLILRQGSYPIHVDTYAGDYADVGNDDWVSLVVQTPFGSPTFFANEIWWEVRSLVAISATLEYRNANITIWQDYEEISY